MFPYCQSWVMKILAGKDTDCRHIEILINRNSYSKVVGSIFRVLTLIVEKDGLGYFVSLSWFWFVLFPLFCTAPDTCFFPWPLGALPWVTPPASWEEPCWKDLLP